MTSKWENNESIKSLQKYLRIRSVHPNVDYEQAKLLDLPILIHEIVPKNPIIVITWEGSNSSLPSIMLNSHMDVVPVYEDSWTYPPFDAHIDEAGDIYARGVQDMKCVGIQYLEAIKKLKSNGIQLKRTFHIVFVPDEELGGEKGMVPFVYSDVFKALNVGFALDEGIADPNESFSFFYGERCAWQFNIHISGQGGHGLLLHPNTAGEKLLKVLSKFMHFREQQIQILNSDSSKKLGDVTSVNLTKINGGVMANVLPQNITVTFDVRIDVNTDLNEFEEMVKQWLKESGEGITYDFSRKSKQSPVTKLDNSNEYWMTFKSVFDELAYELVPIICPGSTDMRYLRDNGIPALGFSPMNKTPFLPHAHDERLNADIFLKGIDVYIKVINALGNMNGTKDPK